MSLSKTSFLHKTCFLWDFKKVISDNSKMKVLFSYISLYLDHIAVSREERLNNTLKKMANMISCEINMVLL